MSTRFLEKILCGDAAGKHCFVEIYQDWIDAGTHDDPHAELPGLKSAFTEDGDHVNFIDADTFEIVATGKRLKRIG